MLTQPPVQWLPGLFLGGLKRPGRGVDHPPPDAQAEEWGRAIPLPLCVPSWCVIETTSPSYITNLTGIEMVYLLIRRTIIWLLGTQHMDLTVNIQVWLINMCVGAMY
jgi:hypothetical protein